jgi:hypothetical protein
MKKIIALLLCLCLLAGCKKDLNYNYAFNVNAVACNGDNFTAFYRYDTAASLREFVADFYVGKVTDTNYVEVSFSGNEYIVPGDYYTGITNPGNTLCSFAYIKNHVYYTNVSGILQILQDDTVGHVLKGNFQFTAANSGDTVKITNGSFAGIRYVVQ